VVRFKDRRILKDIHIQEIGHEFSRLVEVENRKKILLNFCEVYFISSLMLGKIRELRVKLDKIDGSLKLSNVYPEIYEVFAITRLNLFFDIKDDETHALAAF
jgi:anti-sigma B factor antagonist